MDLLDRRRVTNIPGDKLFAEMAIAAEREDGIDLPRRVQGKVNGALGTLEDLTRQIITLRYGVHGDEPLSSEEIALQVGSSLRPDQIADLAARFGVPSHEFVLGPAQVEEIEANALRALRRRPQ